MTTLRTILAALLLCAAPAQAQTLKSLMVNTTNSTVVTPTNFLTINEELIWTNLTTKFRSVKAESFTVSVGTNNFFYAGDDVAEVSTPFLFLHEDGFDFVSTNAAANSRNNLGLGATNAVSFRVVELTEEGSAGATAFNEGGNFVIEHQEGRIGEFSDQLSAFNTTIQTRGNLVVSQQSASTNGLLYIYRTNAEPFLGLANLIASNNTTVSNETLFRVGVSEATNKAAQFGFRSTNTNGNGVAVFSVFGYNALMMIGPSDPSAGTNPIQATVYSIAPTNKVMTLITTNTGAMQMHRPIGIDTAGVSTNAPANTTNVAGWIQFYVGTNSVRVPYYQ